MRVIDILIPLAMTHRRGILTTLAMSVLLSVIALVQPLFMAHLIDEGLVAKNRQALLMWASGATLLALLAWVLTAVNRLGYVRLSLSLLQNLRLTVIKNLMHHQRPFFASHTSGDILSRLQGDLNDTQQFATDSLFALLSTFVGLVGTAVIIVSYNLWLGVGALILLPLEYLLLRPYYERMHTSTHALRRANAHVTERMLDIIRHISLFQNFQATPLAKYHLQTAQDDHAQKTLDNQRLGLIFTQLPALISLVGRTALLFAGGWLVVEGKLGLGVFVAFVSYLGMILAPVQTLLGIMNNLPRVKASLQRVEALFPPQHDVQPLGDDTTITFKNLTFGYPHHPPLLEAINLTIPTGASVAIFGANGTGKSTLGDLLTAQLSPTQGEIFIGETLLTPAHVGQLSPTIIKLDQTAVILGTSLRLNLSLGHPYHDNDLHDALERVGLSSWVASLPLGLETPLFEEGQTLSGGEKQRLAFARALLAQPKILIIDEGTSALDRPSVETFFALIATCFPQTTRIIISHDPMALCYADEHYHLIHKTLLRQETTS